MELDRQHICIHLWRWAFAFWWDPRVWGLDWHFNSCCKVWIDVGPFEFTWLWKEEK